VEDDVGYGKPPRASQFQPGRSGNPNGRPKGSKSEATILHELLQHKVGLNERGKIRKINLLEAILRRVLEDSLKGNIKSVTFLLSRYQVISSAVPAQAEINPDDKAVLESYFRKIGLPKDIDGEST
jgi:hypothetical protein